MPAERLGDAHDHVARLGEGGIHGEIADHARHQAVVGIAGAQGALEQLDAEGFDLVDVLGAGEPAVDLADVPFGRARADLGRQQRAHRGAGGRFGREQVDALFAPPPLIALDRGNHGVLHLLAGTARVKHGRGAGEDLRIVDFEKGGRSGRVWH